MDTPHHLCFHSSVGEGHDCVTLLFSSHTLHADEYLEVDSDDDFVYEEVSYPIDDLWPS